AEACERLGVVIHERTPALELPSRPVRSPGGELRSTTGVRATGCSHTARAAQCSLSARRAALNCGAARDRVVYHAAARTVAALPAAVLADDRHRAAAAGGLGRAGLARPAPARI